MLAAYFDESGHSRDSRVIAMGGLLGNARDWENFAHKWRTLMRRHGDGREIVFHMADLESGYGDFVGCARTQRERLLGDVFALLNEFVFTVVGAAVVVSHYDIAPLRAIFGDPWFVCMQMCMAEIGTALLVREKGDMEEPVAVICDRQMEFSARAMDCFDFLAKRASYGKRLGTIAFGKKEDLVQLQIADLVAYEVRKLVENALYNPQIGVRWPLRRLQERPFVCNYFDLTGDAPTFAGTAFTVFRRSRLILSADEVHIKTEIQD